MNSQLPKRLQFKVQDIGRTALIAGVILCSSMAYANDWPMWRCDSGRTGATKQTLPGDLKLSWVRQLPANAAAYRDQRLQFDRGYEPIVLGQRMFVASATDNSVTALDINSGEQLWKIFVDGPVRFAPVGGKGRVLFGSDDGWFYCVKASTGATVWKFQAVPSNRRCLGNGRLISVWPIRGGPVLHKDRVYFAAGVWPLEGVFIYCLDAATGKVVWLNDRTSYLYGDQPHNTEAFSGIAPQGYLLIDGDDLVVPCSAAYPARLNLETGQLKEFQLPKPGRLPGGWFAARPTDKASARLRRRGLLFDDAVNAKRHEDRPRSEGVSGIRTSIEMAGQRIDFAKGYEGVDGEVHSMLAAAGRVFAVTTSGRIYCFDTEGGARRHELAKAPSETVSSRATELLDNTAVRSGYAVVLGSGDLSFLSTLAARSNLNIVAVHRDPDVVAELREASNWPASRLSICLGDPGAYELPKYFANLIVAEQPASDQRIQKLYQSLRPYGGCLVTPQPISNKLAALDGATSAPGPNNATTLIRRTGGLEGAANYLADWNTKADTRVQAPVGVLWFGDSVSHFKRSPQPAFIDGVMVSIDKDWLDASKRRGGRDYKLLEPTLSDVYTGRIFSAEEADRLRKEIAAVAQKTIVDRQTVQPSQYRPGGGSPTNGLEAFAGKRTNPLTGELEVRKFPKKYGCDGGLDYGNVFTMRSATAAFYDKDLESGTINISGPRSGCTNSVIPANGLLNVPYFYEGCTCSYPLPMALALVSMPETFEQWASWGEAPFADLDGKIQRLGLNFGAPGDRMTRDGTLWINQPNVGGPSPQLSVTTVPSEPAAFYRHSVFTESGDGWPWVIASGVRGLKSVKIDGFKPGSYRVKLLFASPDNTPRTFDVSINGETAFADFNPLTAAGQSMRGVERIADKVAIETSLRIEFDGDESILSGIEVISSDN